MGTRVSVLSAAGRSDALPLTRALFEEWESRLSRFQAGSELSRLNAGAGTPVVVSDLLAEVVATALSAAEASDGVYDPTLLPQLAALGYERSFELMESDQPAAAVASQPGGAWRGIRLDRQARIVELPVGAALDLGGIGKGLAVDSAIELLAAAGHRMAAVEAGGDVRVHGSPPRAAAWPGAVELRSGSQLVELWSGALATSGIGRHAWKQGELRRHHLLDPRTGLPANTGLWSASVCAAQCGEAEVAAKVAFVLGAGAGADFLRARGLAGLLVPEDGDPIRVGAWPA